MISAFKAYFSGLKIKGNLYTLIVWRFLLLMFIFTLTRLLFYIFNIGFFPNTTFEGLLKIFWGGLRFDVTAILYTNLLYFTLMLLPFTFRYNNWYQSALKYLFIVTNSIAIGANCADFIYFQFTLRRTTATVFNEFKNEQNFGAMYIVR